MYSVVVFVGLNLLFFLLIGIGQISIFRAKTQSQMSGLNLSERQLEKREREDKAIAKQLSLIAITDFLCWFPIGVMGVMSVAGHEISREAYTWSAVVILPINSAINPILYTLPAIEKKYREFKLKKNK